MSMDDDKKKQLFNILINNIMRITKSASGKKEKLQGICNLLKGKVPYYDWVGFYIADHKKPELTLGPYTGDPTEHIKIQFGKGICGQAAEKKVTFTIQDVSKETNYLSCSPQVKSEIVVPILRNDKVLGELDIDSHSISPFSAEDEEFLANVCNVISQLF